MVGPVILGIVLAMVAAAVASAAEAWHARRVRRVAYLAYGSAGEPAAWVRAVPVLRVVGVGLSVWGLVVLLLVQPESKDREPDPEASQHLLVCMDASPSMYVADAGPDPRNPEMRNIRAGNVVQAILDRLDAEQTRITVFAIYTGALPVAEETFDKNVARNFFDGVPMYAAFDAGPTRLTSGVGEALEYARRWERGSALLLVVSDGDSERGESIRAIPNSIADAIVIGVGDPRRATDVSGHRSKQNGDSLRKLASRLGGRYFDANERHLPSSVLAGLSMVQPSVADGIGLRDLGVAVLAIGAVLTAFVGPMLAAFGVRRAAGPAIVHEREPRRSEIGVTA